MNFRLTAALFGIVFVLGAILLVLSFREEKKVPTGALLGELELAGVKGPDGIDAIEFERPDAGTLVIVRTDKERNTWQIQKPITAAADPNRVLPVISALLKAKPTPYTELTTNPAVHGLDPPGLKVTLRAGEKSSTLSLGDVTLGDKGVAFVLSSSQSKRPMAVRRGDLDQLFREPGSGTAGALAKWTSDYRATNVFPSDTRAAGEDVASVRIELPNKKQALALSRPLGGAWKFDSPANWGDADPDGDAAGTPGTFTGVRRLLGALTSVTAATPTAFIDQPKDLKEYGLNADNPDLIKVELKTKAPESQSVTVYFGKREGTAPPPLPPGVPPTPNMPGAKVYVRVEGQPGVIHATCGDLSGLNNVVLDPAPLRDRTLVKADRAKVDGIDILLAGQPADKPTKLRRVGQLAQWRLYGGPGDPQLANDAAVVKLLDAVLAPRTIKDFPTPNPANFAAISATVFVWADGFLPSIDGKAEPTQKVGPIKIEFGNRTADTIHVRRTLPGLAPNEFTIPAQLKIGPALVPTDVLPLVALSRLDLLDPALPSFSSEAAAKVAVSGAANYTLEKDVTAEAARKEAVWRYTAPEPKGAAVDTATLEQFLQILSTTQSVTRFVKELPTDAELAEYGFAPAPRLKVAVGFGPTAGDQERVYEFGKDTPDPNFVYARVGGKPAVFTLPRFALDKFADRGLLRDRFILRGVDASKMTKVELKGWGDAGFVTDLTFEKNKDGVWLATKAPAGFVADPSKVNAFLDLLTRQRVKGFEKGGQEGKHGFGDPKQALQITLHWPGGVVALNIGAPADGGAGYYGWSAWTEPVFTLDAAFFKPFKEKPSGFAR